MVLGFHPFGESGEGWVGGAGGGGGSGLRAASLGSAVSDAPSTLNPETFKDPTRGA